MQAFELYLRSEIGASDKTIINYLSIMHAIKAALKAEGKALEAASTDDFRAFIRAKSAAGRKSWTIAGYIVAIRAWRRFRGEDRPTLLQAPRISRTLPEVPNREEVARLLDAAKDHPRDAALLELLYATGIRVAELCALNVADVQALANMLRIFGKGRKERLVPFHGMAREKINTYLLSRPDATAADPLFVADPEWREDAVGRRLSIRGIYELVRRYARRSGQRCNVHPHTIRHCFATHLLQSRKATLGEISHWLGHESWDTTAHYLHLDSTFKKAEHARCHPRERMARGLPPEIPPAERAA